jgi:hypothetical protein
MRSLGNSRGQALIGAMGAALITSLVGTTIASNYASILTQSRRAYVQSEMVNLDAKVRFMAMQPYAYLCGTENGAGQLDGVQSCRVNPDFFKPVRRVIMPGVPCPAGTAPNQCGFTVSAPVLKSITDGGQISMVLSYQLKYEGTDFSVRDMGFPDDATGLAAGIPVPGEILQSGLFNCSIIDPKKPVFSGFDAQGKVRCQGFDVCPVGQYVTAVNPRTLHVTCAPPTNAMIDCPAGQKIATTDWADGVVNGAPCVPLVEAEYKEEVRTPVTPTCTDQQILQDGVCVPKPPEDCPDVTFTINQTAVRSNGSSERPFSAQVSMDFTPYASRIKAGCKISSVDATFRYFGHYTTLTTCENTASYTNVPLGSAPILAAGSCTHCGGSSSKTNQAWFNVAPDGMSGTASNTGAGWGSCGGTGCHACVHDPTITWHTVPQ